MEEQSPTPGLSTDAAVAALAAVTYLSDDESFRKPFTLPKILDVRRRYSKKAMQYDGPAEFNLAAHRRPKLIIANEQFIVHRILGRDNLIGSWRCMYHHKGCKARASTFMVGNEVKYRSTCSSHNHKNVRCKLASLKMPWIPSE